MQWECQSSLNHKNSASTVSGEGGLGGVCAEYQMQTCKFRLWAHRNMYHAMYVLFYKLQLLCLTLMFWLCSVHAYKHAGSWYPRPPSDLHVVLDVITLFKTDLSIQFWANDLSIGIHIWMWMMICWLHDRHNCHSVTWWSHDSHMTVTC